MAEITRALIPRDLTEDDDDRRHHRDIARGDYDATRAWAEAHLLTDWLAGEIFHGRRARMLVGTGPDRYTDEHTWVRERLQRLRAAQGRRQAA